MLSRNTGLEINEQITVLSLLKSILSIPESLFKLRQAFQGADEAIGENPSFPVAVSFVEPRYMVKYTHAAHFAADSLKHAWGEIILFTKGR